MSVASARAIASSRRDSSARERSRCRSSDCAQPRAGRLRAVLAAQRGELRPQLGASVRWLRAAHESSSCWSRVRRAVARERLLREHLRERVLADLGELLRGGPVVVGVQCGERRLERRDVGGRLLVRERELARGVDGDAARARRR